MILHSFGSNIGKSEKRGIVRKYNLTTQLITGVRKLNSEENNAVLLVYAELFTKCNKH